MSLFSTIQTERRAALGVDRVKYNLYGVIISEVQRKTTSTEVDDTVVIQSVKKLLENVTDTLSYGANTQLEAEKVLLENILPKQLTNDELLDIMKAAIEADPSLSEKKNMFPYLKKHYVGQYNGEDANVLFSQLGN